uniref:F-box domain-containing protein n=1 Tax=Oryza nivara TaxID=4536 RepID=A0A0E0GF67_ORYNI
METDSVEREEQGFCEKTNVEWESSAPDGFRHYNLTKLTIYGFQPNENFMGYIRHVMEAAVNLEDISLYDRKVLECCEDLDPNIKVAPSGYLETIQEQELLKKQITEGLVMKKSAAHNNPQLLVDRFTKLPDDLLLNILDRLNTPDAVRTCLLSKRTIHLRHLLSNLDISVDSFVPHYYGYYATSKDAIQIQMNAAVSDATDNILNFRNQEIPLRQLTICFYLKYYDCLTIGKAVARAMATHNLDSAEFIILTGNRAQHCSIDDLRHNGKQLMTFFGACTDAFAGLTRLHLRNLRLAETDILNIIATCKRLEYLRLSMCQTEDSVLQMKFEHPRLVELNISSAGLELVELSSLPNLKRLVFSLWNCPQEPLSFGNVPLLSSLSLTDESMRWQKVIRLSQFLPNVLSIRDLHLNFSSEKIWVQPECPKLLAHVLRNLQVLNLDELPEGCDIAWTRFFIEAAPVLKELCITVWDHWCEMETDSVEREAQGFCDKTNVEWESSAPDGFRHYNLTKLTIYGFQPNDNFLGYIRHIMEAAVNLEDVSLYDRKVLECCEDLDPKIKVAPTGYPETI